MKRKKPIMLAVMSSLCMPTVPLSLLEHESILDTIEKRKAELEDLYTSSPIPHSLRGIGHLKLRAIRQLEQEIADLEERDRKLLLRAAQRRLLLDLAEDKPRSPPAADVSPSVILLSAQDSPSAHDKLADPAKFPLMTVPEVMAVLGISRATVYRCLDDGRLDRPGMSKRPGKKSKALVFTASVRKMLEPAEE